MISRFVLVALTGCTTVISLGAPPAADAGAPDAALEDAATTFDASTCVSPVGTSTLMMVHASLARTYDVIAPQNLAPCGQRRALLAFHQYGATTSSYGDGNRRDLIIGAAARAGAMVVLVQGSVTSATQKAGWGCAGCTNFEAADDVGFVRAIVSSLGIDASKSTALGIDVGASFVHRLAAELPFESGVVLAGTLGTADDGRKSDIVRPVARGPVTMVLEHGENDDVFPYEGGATSYGGAVTPFSESVAFWRQANGCGASQVVATTTSETATYDCGATKVIAVRWLKTGHSLPNGDAQNPAIAVDAIIAQLFQ